jgi:hypothetical protein
MEMGNPKARAPLANNTGKTVKTVREFECCELFVRNSSELDIHVFMFVVSGSVI